MSKLGAERRVLLITLGAGAIGTGLGAIGFEALKYRGKISETIGSLLEPVHLGSEYPEVIEYYPELSRFIVYDEQTISLEKRSVRLFNFSQTNFHSDAAESLYEFYYEVASSQATRQMSYSIDGTEEKLLLGTYENNRETLFIVLPGPLPRQLIEAKGPDVRSGFTHISYGNEDNSITIIIMAHDGMAPEFFAGSVEAYLSIVSASRICDSVINVIPITVDLNNSERLARVSSVGRQAVSSSIGVAAWQKQEGNSYQNYKLFAKEIKGFVLGQEEKFPLIVIPEEMYIRIPEAKVLTIKD